MANDRKVITGVSVIAKEGGDLESGTKYIIDSTVSKVLGGKSNVDIYQNQWHATDWYKSTLTVTNGMTKIGNVADDCAFLYIKNLDASFGVIVTLGVKQEWDGVGEWSTDNNWGDSTYTDRPPNYDGWWDEGAHISVSAGGSILLRGDGTNLKIKEVYARPQSITDSPDGVEVEIIIAKE